LIEPAGKGILEFPDWFFWGRSISIKIDEIRPKNFEVNCDIF
jgi:hypothetical protein